MNDPSPRAEAIELFYSYSHKDKELRDKLNTHLSALKRKGIIKEWYDRDIDAGTDWVTEIDSHLDSANLILLLISPDFIASDYAYEIEMKRALKRHEEGSARVIPIILRPTDWKDLPFGKLQFLPVNTKPITSWPNEDDGFLNVVLGIRRVIETINPVTQANTFGRLNSTNDNLPPRFYGKLVGRNEDIERVMEGLDSRFPIITIEGFAGIGKTSLAIETGYLCLLKSDTTLPLVVTFEYVVWVSAKDKPEQKQWLEEVLNEIARVMGYPKITQRPLEQIEEKKKEIEYLLRRHKVLIIVDNFETIDDLDLVRWIQRVPEPSKLLVTTRIRQLQAAWTIDLKGLEDREALKLIRQYAYTLGLYKIESEDDDKLLSLVKVTGGNPKALELALGHIKGGSLSLKQIIDQIYTNNPNRSMETVFEYLHSESWRQIGLDARKIILITPLFVGVSSISRDALRTASGLSAFEFEEGLQKLLDWRLLEPEQDDSRLAIHSITREFARTKLNEDPEFEAEARDRWSRYYLGFIEDNIKRETPASRYWNTLVTDKMQLIDAEWLPILEVMKWADQEGQDRILLDLVMLLVHYMDSRLLNLERLTYVKKAIAAAQGMKLSYDEALLRIDALGWTYVEENRPDEAYREIMNGFEIAKEISEGDKADLIALGFAWRARVRIEQQRPADAGNLITQALAQDCSSWVKYRVYMAAGDIALKEGGGADALGFYENALSEYKKYGGEGQGYQIAPRIGLAYMDIGEIDKAEEQFKELRDQEQIPIGKLYAEYGLALVAYKKGDKDSARNIVKTVREELSRRTNSNLLLNLINDLFETLKIENH